MYLAGRGPPARLVAALGELRHALRPTLVVLDEAESAPAELGAALGELVPALAELDVLVPACGRDADALGVPAQDALVLEPLDAEAVRAIAAERGTPAEWLIEQSDGVPRRVHEAAGRWARREAARRVDDAAVRAAAGRAELRSVEAELTGGVIELQAAREDAEWAGQHDTPVRCPFRGLASFDVADAPYFFGRERLVAELVARLVGATLLGVVGPSGSGKSSVVRAGLLPALAGGVLPGSADWDVVVMRPGEHPLRELANATAQTDRDRGALLAVDQFEETFTMCRDEEERRAFVAELAAGRGGRIVGAGDPRRLLRALWRLPGAVAACSPRITSSSARCAATSYAARWSAPRSGSACAWNPSSPMRWWATSSASRARCRCSRPRCSSCGSARRAPAAAGHI